MSGIFCTCCPEDNGGFAVEELRREETCVGASPPTPYGPKDDVFAASGQFEDMDLELAMEEAGRGSAAGHNAPVYTPWKPWLAEAPPEVVEDSVLFRSRLEAAHVTEEDPSEDCSSCEPCGLSNAWKPHLSSRAQPVILVTAGQEGQEGSSVGSIAARFDDELGEPLTGAAPSTFSTASSRSAWAFGDPCTGPLHSDWRSQPLRQTPGVGSGAGPSGGELGEPRAGPPQSARPSAPRPSAHGPRDDELGAPVSGALQSTASARSVPVLSPRPQAAKDGADLSTGAPVTGPSRSTASSRPQRGRAAESEPLGDPVTGPKRSTGRPPVPGPEASGDADAEFGAPVAGPAKSTWVARRPEEGFGAPVAGPTKSTWVARRPEEEDAGADFGAPVAGPTKSSWDRSGGSMDARSEAADAAPGARSRDRKPSELAFGEPCTGPLKSVSAPSRQQAASHQLPAETSEATAAGTRAAAEEIRRRSGLTSGLFGRRLRSSSPVQTSPRRTGFNWRPHSLPPTGDAAAVPA